MKKKLIGSLLVLCSLLSLCVLAHAETSDDSWKEKPVITEIYEIEDNNIQVNWTGKSNSYLMNLDGKELHRIRGNSTTLSGLKQGSHRIRIIPLLLTAKETNTEMSIEIPVIGGGGSWDWRALGVDPKDVHEGEQSELVEFSYDPTKLEKSTPEIKPTGIDTDDRVIVSFVDFYNSDIYKIYISRGKNDERCCDFDIHDAASAQFIDKNNSNVSITLDPSFFSEKNWAWPNLNEEYTFQVQLVKYPENIINKEPITTHPIYSQKSKTDKYTPISIWKTTATRFIYNSQDGEGSLILRWDHDDLGRGCEYEVYQLDKLLVVKKGEKLLDTVKEKEYEIHDLINGKYTFMVVPVLNGEKGEASEPVTIEVKADWITAPMLECTNLGDKRVLLKWAASEKVESYHINIYAGSGSILRLVNLDFKKIDEIDIPAETGEIEYEYQYTEPIEEDSAVRLMFEIYGIRHTADEAEQTSSTTKQTITLD